MSAFECHFSLTSDPSIRLFFQVEDLLHRARNFFCLRITIRLESAQYGSKPGLSAIPEDTLGVNPQDPTLRAVNDPSILGDQVRIQSM